MLKIFYELKPFFEDIYREISVREYARESKISPPTASKVLKNYEQESLLHSSKKGIYIYFRSDRNSFLFKELAKLYWYSVLHPITEDLHREISFRRIILFGSLAKVENTTESDIDLFLDIPRRELISSLDKKVKRKVEYHFAGELENQELKASVEKGVIIR